MAKSRTSFICVPVSYFAHRLVPAKQRTEKQIDDILSMPRPGSCQVCTVENRLTQTCFLLWEIQEKLLYWTPSQTVAKVCITRYINKLASGSRDSRASQALQLGVTFGLTAVSLKSAASTLQSEHALWKQNLRHEDCSTPHGSQDNRATPEPVPADRAKTAGLHHTATCSADMTGTLLCCASSVLLASAQHCYAVADHSNNSDASIASV